MATAGAVSAAGLTLQALLADRVEHPNGNSSPVPVTLGFPGPDRDPQGVVVDEPRINLFLYQVVENCFLQNQEIPGHGHPAAYGHPPLSLDLRFLLTAFGNQDSGVFFDETPAHLLLGSAMQVLHDNAIITGSLVTRRPPTGRLILDPALRDEFESLKVTIHPLGLEDLSNIWTALELSYRLTVAYEVSVVQIESDQPRRRPRPVGELPGGGPRVFLVPLQRPNLSSIGVRRADDPPGTERSVPFARVGDTLILHGSRLSGGGLVVQIGRREHSRHARRDRRRRHRSRRSRRGPRGRDADRPGRPLAAGDAHRRGGRGHAGAATGLDLLGRPADRARAARRGCDGRREDAERDRDATARSHCAGRDPHRRHDRRACGIRGRLDRHLGRGELADTLPAFPAAARFPARWLRSRRSLCRST